MKDLFRQAGKSSLASKVLYVLPSGPRRVFDNIHPQLSKAPSYEQTFISGTMDALKVPALSLSRVQTTLVTLLLNLMAMTGRAACSKFVRIALPVLQVALVAAALAAALAAVAASEAEVDMAAVGVSVAASVVVEGMVVATVVVLLLLVATMPLEPLRLLRQTLSPTTLPQAVSGVRPSMSAM